MSNRTILDQFKLLLDVAISYNQLIKVSLSNYKGNDDGLKNLYVKKVKIKRLDKLSFNYRYKNRDIFKNLDVGVGISLIIDLISNDFRVCNLISIDKDISLEHNHKGNLVLREKLKSFVEPLPSLNHDHEKKRPISAKGSTYLNALKVTDIDGNVYKAAQDKYKQINRYIELLNPLIKELLPQQNKHIVDMGSGKGYLTFALYDYLSNILGIRAEVIGVEFREELVQFCNEVAEKSKFDGLKFVQGSIQEFEIKKMDILIALHACDTATDDAIYKGIKADASLIVVAPCCHKQIRREMEKWKVTNEVSVITKYGIFLERQAEMVTDALRALVLQYFGYKTKVMEFISDVHTPKNILIVGIKGGIQSPTKKSQILAEIKQTMIFFGIGEYYLAKLFDI
ncbi:class I SAM-dependent methyltransferase [Pedobacter sp. PWIIR3]